jgi:acetyl esterase/lipase
MQRSPPRPIHLSLRQRLEFHAARWLFSLPAALQVWLAGRRPVIVQDCVLDPQMQLMLALHALLQGAPVDRDVAQVRKTLRYEAMAIAGRPIAVGAVADLAIDGGGGTIGARHYAPVGDGAKPLLVFFHGGGFVAGDLDTHDNLCRRICRDADIHVLAVDYRLAPEHRFPAAVEDTVAAFRWTCRHAAALGATPDKIAVGGDSAGGNLAAVVSQQAVADGGPVPCAQVLLYPPVDRTGHWPSVDRFGDGFLLRSADIDWYHLQYTGSPVPQPDPAQNPLCAASFAGLPPALIATAGFDPLRDEGEAYAEAMRKAGVPVVLKRCDGLLHGFASMAAISPACDAALAGIITELRTLMTGAPAIARRRKAV